MEVPQRMVQIVTLLIPVLLSSLLALWVLQPWLNRLQYWRGVALVNGVVVILTLSIYSFGGALFRPADSTADYFEIARYALLSVLTCCLMLIYFRLRSKVLSRALHDARLQVLRARIRPHFLFNCINTVLGVIRTQPRQAETALEDMADLFRAAMADADVQNLVLLSHEIQLTKQYLALEQLRMGKRLQVEWQLHDVPDDALVPPLLLQPLLENAVYHGIEPLPQGGRISTRLRRTGDEIILVVENPCQLRNIEQHSGNHMALQNIRERLDLLFDVEARYQVEVSKDFYRAEIVLPYIKGATV
jgi:two-component system sensor histidine kinase AlgZ